MTVTKPRRFAFVVSCGFSHSNDSIRKFLATEFPSHEMEVIDIPSLVRGNKLLVAINVIHTLGNYGWSILRKRASFRECFLRTPYLFKHVRKMVSTIVRDQEYEFTFQTQSLFDTSCSGVPHFVYTDHVLMANLNNGKSSLRYLYSPGWRELERSIYCNADRVFTMTRSVSQILIDDYGCDVSRVACVYAGSNAAPQPHVCTDTDRYSRKNILFVGMDWHRKGGPLLVEAFKKVRRKHPDATLTVIGCRPNVNVPGCKVLGKIPLHKMTEHFARASVFCMPSLREPFGIVYVEALQNGLPIVAFDTGAAPDLVGKCQTGALVTCGDTDGLAAALCNFLDHPGYCRALAQRGLKLVRHRYNWPAVSRHLARHIRSVVRDSNQVPDSAHLKMGLSQFGLPSNTGRSWQNAEKTT